MVLFTCSLDICSYYFYNGMNSQLYITFKKGVKIFTLVAHVNLTSRKIIYFTSRGVNSKKNIGQNQALNQ